MWLTAALTYSQRPINSTGFDIFPRTYQFYQLLTGLFNVFDVYHIFNGLRVLLQLSAFSHISRFYNILHNVSTSQIPLPFAFPPVCYDFKHLIVLVAFPVFTHLSNPTRLQLFVMFYAISYILPLVPLFKGYQLC